MLTDKPLNLFTYVKCGLQVLFFTSHLVAFEGGVWGKWARGWNNCRRNWCSDFTAGNTPEDPRDAHRTNLLWAALAAGGGWSLLHSQAARGFITQLCSLHGPFIGSCAKLVLCGGFLTGLWWTGAAVDELKAAPFSWESLCNSAKKSKLFAQWQPLPKGSWEVAWHLTLLISEL